VLGEALVIVLAGGALALVANALSPRGLQLGRNYFPAAASTTAGETGGLAATGASNPAAPKRPHGFPVVSRAEVEALLQDPGYASGTVLLLDARNDAHYRAGHIPGALQFDHYRAEQHLGVVIPASFAARRIVVYCGGGTCEDSEFAARMLRDAGVPAERLFLYEGGMADWQAAGLPVETGARFSGEIKFASP